jgi:hypothetical protein
VALFKKLDLDHLVVLRGAPNGSAYNKIERAMSPANSSLANVSVKRGVMADWAEALMKNANSMAEIRSTNDEHEKKRANARHLIEVIDCRLELLAVKQHIITKLRDIGGTNLKDTAVESIASAVLDWIGGEANGGIEFNNVMAEIEMEDGQVETRSSTITQNSLEWRRIAAEKIASSDFRAEYDKSVKQQIDAICERLSKFTLVTSH